MLIIPVENKPDWRRPPVVTLLLVVVNVWIYFALLGGDETVYADARQTYLAGDLIEHEAALYREYHEEVHGGELPDAPHALADYVLLDLGFDAYLAPHLADDVAWAQAREAFERVRNQLSWIRLGLVPADAAWWSYFTSMFLHGSVGHLIGNMVFLFIFGFALERLLGPLNYTAVYLLGGLGGGAVHVLASAGSHVPTIGASGAVSALMGAYLAVYQLRRIRFFYSVLVYFGEFRAPALVVLPLWLAKELYGHFSGSDGVAYWAHIGGLVSGAGLGWLAMATARGVDTDYLEQGSRRAASHAQVERLDTLIDEFKYYQAKAVAATHLAAYPDDVATWEKYLGLLAADRDDPEYHRAARRLFSLAGTWTEPEALRLVESVFRNYSAGRHPKPALKDARVLCSLGEAFARAGRLDESRRIANSLLKANRREPELGRLLRVLSTRLAEAGSGALASHYSKEMSARFPEAS